MSPKYTIQKCLQPPLVKPFPEPDNRASFWKDLKEKPFQYIANVCGKNGLKYRAKRIYHKMREKLKI